MSGGVLVAGVGNVFLGDDGFGVALAQRLEDEAMPTGVTVQDFGIRGMHLAFELLDGYDALVLLDAVPLGEAPGTLAVLDAEVPAAGGGGVTVSAHSMSPDAVLATVAELGGHVPRVMVVGCQPEDVTARMGLSEPVADAVERAVSLVQEVVAALGRPPAPGSGQGGRSRSGQEEQSCCGQEEHARPGQGKGLGPEGPDHLDKEHVP